MSSTEVYESLLHEIAAMERPTLLHQLADFPGDLRLDFSPDFLHTCDTDRLRHLLLLAARWRCRMKSITP